MTDTGQPVDRITEILTPFFANFSDEDAARANAGEAAEAVLPALAAMTPCTCRQVVHASEHTNRPVDGCPWCTPAPNIRPNRPGPAATTVDARLLRSNAEA